MKKICIVKNGDGLKQYFLLQNEWQENSIELIWDINKLRNNAEITLVSINNSHSNYHKDDNISFYNVIINSKKKSVQLLQKIRYLIKLLIILKKQKIDVLVISNFYFLGFLLLYCKISRIQIIPNFSRNEQLSSQNINLIKIFKVPDVISPGFLLDGTNFGASTKIHYRLPLYPINFFVDDHSIELPKHRYIISFIGRLIKAKGIYEFLVAANRLIAQNLDIGFYILGDGPERSYVTNFIKGNNLADQVHYMGNQTNIAIGTYLRKSTILVVPSFTEGFSKTWLEAILCETPVILTKLSGIEKLIEDRKHGLYIKIGSADDIEEKILELINNSNLYLYLRENLKKIKDNGILKNGKSFYQVIESIIMK